MLTRPPLQGQWRTPDPEDEGGREPGLGGGGPAPSLQRGPRVQAALLLLFIAQHPAPALTGREQPQAPPQQPPPAPPWEQSLCLRLCLPPTRGSKAPGNSPGPPRVLQWGRAGASPPVRGDGAESSPSRIRILLMGAWGHPVWG